MNKFIVFGLTALAVVSASAVKLHDDVASRHATPITDNIKGRENTEWSIAYSYHVTDAKRTLPRVLLVGDSITAGYQSKVARNLEGKVDVSYWASSYSIQAPMFWRLFPAYLGDLKYDIIHFNNGGHSDSLTDAEYQEGLRRAYRMIREKQPQAKVIWVSSTACCKPEITARFAKMNALAESVATSEGVTLRDDLFALVNPWDRAKYWRDTYHYTDEGIEKQARVVADCILSALNPPAKATAN